MSIARGHPRSLAERVGAWFESEGWPVEANAGEFTTNFGGKTGEWPFVVQVHEVDGLVVCRSIVPFSVDPDQLDQAMEAVIRANYGLALGAFDLDVVTGGMQFRTSIDVSGEIESLTDGVLHHLCYQNVVTMDRYLPALRAVVRDGLSAREAIALVE